jgi:hypothetical protein
MAVPKEAVGAEARTDIWESARERMRELMRDPEFAAQVYAALERDPDVLDDEVGRRVAAGEFAEEAFRETYGDEFLERLRKLK